MFDIVILIGAICGPIMVIGSMALLYSGAISLRGAACDGEALSIELIKEIKLSTRYPALALFIIGFVFFISAAWFAQQGNVKKIRAVAKRFDLEPLPGTMRQFIEWLSTYTLAPLGRVAAKC